MLCGLLHLVDGGHYALVPYEPRSGTLKPKKCDQMTFPTFTQQRKARFDVTLLHSYSPLCPW